MGPAPLRGALPTALWLLRSGLWPVPVTPRSNSHPTSGGKSPIGRGWGVTRATAEGLRAVFARHPRAGVGVALGPAAGVVDVEVDDPVRAAAVLARLELPPTLGWGSARGEHRLFAWDERLEGGAGRAVAYVADGAVEIRLGGAGKQLLSVCPPTVGSDGRCRAWNGVWEVARFPDGLLGLLSPPPARAGGRREQPAPPVPIANRYAAAAVRAEVALVRAAAVGTRNRTLNRAAFNLGQLVAAGLVPREVVESELTAAAVGVGLHEREVLATLRSGVEAGMKHPRR